MKRIINFLALLLLGWQADAQFYIGPGATVSANLGGITVITLAGGDFINDGTFSSGTSDFYFLNNSGDDLSIGGTGNTTFDYLYVKTGAKNLVLEQDINAALVIFEDGHFDLNGNNVNLAGIIVDEDETRSFIGPNGGEIVHQTNLTAPSGANPGNLGAVITSVADLGEVTIRRTHLPDMDGGAESINRRYTITPANNAGLDATLRFFYLENELNGLSENDLELWRNEGPGWDLQGTTDRDANENWLELSGIDAFSEWTAAELDFTPVIELDGNRALLVGELFPNPVSTGNGYVQLAVTSPENLQINLRIVDGLGRVLYKNEYDLMAGEQVLQLSHPDLSAGMYQVQMEAEGRFAVLKLVVQ